MPSRDEEYAEVLERNSALRQELADERARGRTTYAEVEESEADLELDPFAHVSEGSSRMAGWGQPGGAAGCPVLQHRLTLVTNRPYPQLTRSCLSHVHQGCQRGDTIAAANGNSPTSKGGFGWCSAGADALIFGTLFNLGGGVNPEMVATDHVSCSDMVFGLLKMLGYRFSPRLRDVSDPAVLRANVPREEEGDYGPLKAVTGTK